MNENTRLQCWYCTNEYSITTIGQHLSTGCKIALESKGKDYEKGKQIKKENQKKYLEKNSDYDERLKRNKKRWEKELSVNEPKHHYLHKFISVDQGHFFSWDNFFLEETIFSVPIREQVYSIISVIFEKILVKINLMPEYGFRNATKEDHQKFKKLGESFYRNLQKYFHPD